MPFNRPIPDSRHRDKFSSGIGALIEAEKLMQIAILLPASAFIGWLVGSWADARLHQSWIGLAGILFGGIAGLVHVVRLAIAAGGGTGGEKKAGKGSPQIKP
jgi:hypothetical protein